MKILKVHVKSLLSFRDHWGPRNVAIELEAAVDLEESVDAVVQNLALQVEAYLQRTKTQMLQAEEVRAKLRRAHGQEDIEIPF